MTLKLLSEYVVRVFIIQISFNIDAFTSKWEDKQTTALF